MLGPQRLGLRKCLQQQGGLGASGAYSGELRSKGKAEALESHKTVFRSCVCHQPREVSQPLLASVSLMCLMQITSTSLGVMWRKGQALGTQSELSESPLLLSALPALSQ